MKWLLEIDHKARSGGGYSLKTVESFKEAKMEANRISKRDDVYLVSLYRFTNKLLTSEHKEARAYVQRNGGKLHSANSAYYRQYENDTHMTMKFMQEHEQYEESPFPAETPEVKEEANIIKAIRCNNGCFRIDFNNNRPFEVYDSFSELSERYEILGTITPAIVPTWALKKKR